MTSFDILVLSFLASSIIFAFLRGFVKSAISFAGLIFIAFLAFNLGFLFSPIIEMLLLSHALSVVVTATVLFILFFVIMSFINGVLFVLVSPLAGGLIDRFVGLLFGLIRGCILASFVFHIMTLVYPSLEVKDKSDVFYDNHGLPGWAKNSESILLLSRGAGLVSNFIPENFSKILNKSIMESKNSKGGFDLPNNRIKDIHRLNRVFGMMPDSVLDEMSQKDLIKLQDQSADPHEKVKILEDMARQYQRYISDRASYHSEDIKKINKRYHDVISSLNKEINRYNSMVE